MSTLVHSALIGLTAGARAMTPLAVVSEAARAGALPDSGRIGALLARPLVSAGTKALAAGELAGDKLPSAPDRIVLAGMAGRIVTGAVTGAALAPADRRRTGALLGVAAAVGAAYLTFAVRIRAMRRYGQVPTGVVEDAINLAGAVAVTRAARAH